MTEARLMSEIASDVAKAMCYGRVRNTTAFVSTGVTYTNGVATIVRIDPSRDGFVVSDDGYAAVIAESMGAASALNRVAPGVAGRAGVNFEHGAFVLSKVAQSSLHIAVGLIANTSARAIERMAASLEQPRIKRSRDLFDKRLRAAFGDKVAFDLEYPGATGRKWEFDAGVERNGAIIRLFELVSPTTQAVAMANMKITDTQALLSPPIITAALADYDGTDPALRSILSNAGSVVIAANDEVSRYRLSAA